MAEPVSSVQMVYQVLHRQQHLHLQIHLVSTGYPMAKVQLGTMAAAAAAVKAAAAAAARVGVV
jgi:hypothetical protein